MSIAQIKAKIISNQRLNGDYGDLEFESGIIAEQANPGQFLNVRVADVFEPLLRRPFSIHGVKDSKVRILYRILGKGTQALAERKPGEFLDIIGPLGNGFDYQPLAKSEKAKSILVAGGMGVAPLVFLAEKLKNTKPLVLIGARTKNEIICAQEFEASGCKLGLATDDGSLGFHGQVTDLLKTILEKTHPQAIFSCGPQAMLKALCEIGLKNGIDTQLSLEEHMACGLGACLGCVVLTKSGHKTVCKDGPVFTEGELIW